MLMIWFAPYLLTLFIFVSVSLWLVGLMLLKHNESLEYGFTVGPVTLGCIVLTVLVLVFAVIRRHGADDGESPSP